MSPDLIEKHKDKLQREPTIFPFTDTLVIPVAGKKCVFLTDQNACAIYFDRPQICQMYGEVAGLVCGKIDPEQHRKDIERLETLFRDE